MNKNTTQALKYALLPEIFPRIQDLFSTGFVHISYLFAVIFTSLKLLPPGHPYLNPANAGRYGIRHVIAQAANNLTLDRHNIDKILVFSVLVLGVVLLAVQFALFAVSLFFQHEVFAGSGHTNPVSPFVSVLDLLQKNSQYGHGPTSGSEAQDIAFIVLDRVFGTQRIFNSCIAVSAIDCLDLGGNPPARLRSIPHRFPYSFSHNAALLFPRPFRCRCLYHTVFPNHHHR